jgi:DNA helicase HerA-like ATPase
VNYPNPIDPDWYIGTVTQVTASQVTMNLPNATARPERRGLAMGAVGDFVFVDCERLKILGRIVETKVPDGERLTVEPRLGEAPEPHPIGRVQLLAAVEQGSHRLQRGLPHFPRIGDGVYLAEPKTLATLIRNAVSSDDELTLKIGSIDAGDNVEICLPPEKVFGRHCGIFGATGGGKSWTLATLIHQLKEAGGKAVVLDPTGEFDNIGIVDRAFVFDSAEPSQVLVHFPYRQITEDDLFSLLRPSGQSQGPKLREAIKSLKLVAAAHGLPIPGVQIQNGLLEKLNRPRAPILAALVANGAYVHAPVCNFDISNLAEQIKNECVWGTSNVAGHYGGVENNAIGHCETLVARINTLIHSHELECIFRANGTSLVDELDRFFADDTRDVALISFKDVRFEHNTREILLNIIGRYLLNRARAGEFKTRPVVVFLDEAHQFLGRTIGDDYASVRLDSFGLIAKEGRKYGLTSVMATQRPRDIPQDVLSQLGTLFVHRLTNDQDRETVERACGDLDKGAAQFIPMLAPGEAIVIGPDLPAPVPLFINRPPVPPDSKGPPYQAFWTDRRANPRPVPVVQAAPAAAAVAPEPAVELDDEIPF